MPFVFKHFFIFILLLCFTGYGQHSCEYEEYFALTAAAHKDLVKDDYKSAAEKFKKAFSISVFPQGKDVAAALKTAKKEKDNEWAYTLAIQLARGGIPLRYFTSFKKDKWYKAFEKDFPEYIAYYTENFDLELRHQVLDLRVKDIALNNKFYSWKAKEIEVPLNEFINDATALLQGFKTMREECGFPGEQRIGYYYTKSRVDEFPTGVLLIHIYQTSELLYFNELDDLVCGGYITEDYKKILMEIRGYTNGEGAEQEWKVRYEKFRKEKP